MNLFICSSDSSLHNILTLSFVKIFHELNIWKSLTTEKLSVITTCSSYNQNLSSIYGGWNHYVVLVTVTRPLVCSSCREDMTDIYKNFIFTVTSQQPQMDGWVARFTQRHFKLIVLSIASYQRGWLKYNTATVISKEYHCRVIHIHHHILHFTFILYYSNVYCL